MRNQLCGRSSPDRRRNLARVVFVLAVLTASSGCFSGPQTQFGRNVVQYDRFDFKILQTEHFDIYYYDEEAEAVRQAGRMAERWYARLSRLFNHELRGRQVIIYYASHPHFRQTAALGGPPGEGTGGATEVFKRRIVLPFAGPLQETDHVLGHELVHAFQFDMTGAGGTITNMSFPNALRMPLWFIEGMAEYVSVGPNDPHTAMWIRDAASHDRIPTMRQLNNPSFFPYRFGQAFWAYVAGRFGDEVVGRILNAGARSGSAEAALRTVLRIPVDSLNAEWQEAIHLAYDDIAEETDSLPEIGHVILSREDGSVLNSSPALNPDGTEIIFVSFRTGTSIDLYRANAETGEVYNKLVEMETDAHYEGMQFIRSAGAWSGDGKRFVFGAIRESDPSLVFVDVASEKVERQKVFPELGEIFNPSWSPDNRYVAFSAIVGGFSDLYVYDVERDTTQRITADGFADLQPAWSPDGRQLVFTTDRFTTDLNRLRYGKLELALCDPTTGHMQPLPVFDTGKHLNPQWSRDGRSVYFLSDRTGVTNVYRVDLATREAFQVTNLYTGVTGITALSPALSSSLAADKIAFSVYQRGGYSIVTVDRRDILRGRPVS